MTQALTLTSAQMTATISPHGARLETFSYTGDASLVLHADPDQAPTWRAIYPGAIVGPIANRVKAGAVSVDGQAYQMACNETGMTALHSGPNGLDQRIWDVKHSDADFVHLNIVLQDGDMGLPGLRVIDVRYTLSDTTLTLDIRAETDAPTPINIAHHPYWRLGDAAAHRLQINADHYLPVDAQRIPTGEIAKVAGTVFDHRHAKPLDPGLDHNFCVRTTKQDAPAPMATLHGADGLILQIDSTEPGLQAYSGARMPTLPGTDAKPFAGIALEPQGWPDAVNQPDFPSIICTPNRPYRQITRYRMQRAT